MKIRFFIRLLIFLEEIDIIGGQNRNKLKNNKIKGYKLGE